MSNKKMIGLNFIFVGILFLVEYRLLIHEQTIDESGTGYYCDERCMPDTSQSQGVRIAIPSFDPLVVASELREMGVTHLLFSSLEYSFISSKHDPTGLHKRAGDFSWNDFYPVCASEIYVDPWPRIFEIPCDSS